MGRLSIPARHEWGGALMESALSPSAERIQDALRRLGVDAKVIEMGQSTRTAADAADAVGCEVGQIAKSLVFKTRRDDRPILVITSGSNRVDEKKISGAIGEPIAKADADFVRERTGFAIGGVPPVGHRENPLILIDADLLQYETVWAAAGTPRAVFQLTPQELQRITGGRVIALAR
jgi:prolyl-tRNA editing enzyme YbaK/EbsC (Cys-tRNA(Pro) deacylase)